MDDERGKQNEMGKDEKKKKEKFPERAFKFFFSTLELMFLFKDKCLQCESLTIM